MFLNAVLQEDEIMTTQTFDDIIVSLHPILRRLPPHYLEEKEIRDAAWLAWMQFRIVETRPESATICLDNTL